jgi:hypothetical protein
MGSFLSFLRRFLAARCFKTNCIVKLPIPVFLFTALCPAQDAQTLVRDTEGPNMDNVKDVTNGMQYILKEDDVDCLSRQHCILYRGHHAERRLSRRGFPRLHRQPARYGVLVFTIVGDSRWI